MCETCQGWIHLIQQVSMWVNVCVSGVAGAPGLQELPTADCVLNVCMHATEEDRRHSHS